MPIWKVYSRVTTAKPGVEGFDERDSLDAAVGRACEISKLAHHAVQFIERPDGTHIKGDELQKLYQQHRAKGA